MQNEYNTEKEKKNFNIGGVIAAIATLLFLCLLTGLGLRSLLGQRASEAGISETEASPYGMPEPVFLEEALPFGGTERWEHWTDYLVSMAADAPYVFAFAQVGDASADFSWGFYEDREAFVAAFGEKKAMTGRTGEDGGSLPWYFVKLRMDDGIYGIDIYEYMKQNLSEEGYGYQACTLDEGRAYAIWQAWLEAFEEQYSVLVKREGVVRDGYLYLLACDGADAENIEEVNAQLQVFENQFNSNAGAFRSGWMMDEDTLYWADHTLRETRLENPERVFIEERATETERYDKLMAYFPLMREARYQIRLAPEMPEMVLTFQFAQEIPDGGYETYLFNGFSMDEPYKMEIRNAADDSLMQRTDVNLCIERIDTINFEDLDGDGCLEMKIIYPSHWSGFDDLEIHHEDYWTWNREIEKLVRISKEELLAKREEDSACPEEDGIPQTNPSVIPVTVQKGDCLWKLAARYYGDGSRWMAIYEYNRPVIGDNPNLIYEGTKLQLPWMPDSEP